MNSQNPEAAEVWNRTLVCLRKEKHLRKKIRWSLATTLPLLACFLAIFLLRPGVEPSFTAQRIAAIPEAPDSLAVMVVRNGVPTLETISAEDLGAIELRFSLDPVLSDYDVLTGANW